MMAPSSLPKIKKIVSRFEKTRVLVLGDIILDHFIWGKVSRISPEAPVPIVKVHSESIMPGGAANVANNLRSLGIQTSLIGILGDDRNGHELKTLFKKKKISTEGMIIRKNYPTTKKTRIIAHHQQVVRVDREKVKALSRKETENLFSKIEKLVPRFHAVVLEDYDKGVLSRSLVQKVIELCRKHGVLSAFDPKMGHDLDFSGATLSTPNFEEAEYLGRFFGLNSSNPLTLGPLLRKKLAITHLLITLGEEGMALFSESLQPSLIPAQSREVYDVSGAGDTVVSTFSACLAAGASPLEAAQIANTAAGIVVGKLGTATVSPEEIIKSIKG